MKTPKILTTTIALLLFAPSARAVTDTWDGGDPGTNNISASVNWADNSAPVSDLSNTDLVFGGSTRLSPNVDAASFGARSITFNFTAGAFTLGGNPIVLGFIGIVNDDTQTQTINNALSSPFASTTIDAASGGLTFGGTVSLPTTTLFVDGANATSFRNFSGTATVEKRDAGTMSYSPTATQNLDLEVTAGTVNTLADGSTDVFSNSASLAVSGTGALNFGESATLSGAQLTRASGLTLTLAAGKTLTIQNGGDATITGSFTNGTAATITVTGAGSTFSTSTTLTLNGGTTASVLADADLSAGTGLNIGTGGSNGTLTVDGAGSTVDALNTAVGNGGGVGSLTLSSGSAGSFLTLTVGSSTTAGSSGTVAIQSGADATADSMVIAAQAAATTGTVTVDGAGSTLAITGASNYSLGAASASTATLNVQNGGVFTSGTGTTTVRATGTIALNGGTYTANGDLTLDAGQLTRDAAGTLTLAAGRTLTVQNGGDATITGTFVNSTASTITVTGAGSTFSTTGHVSADAGTTLNVLAGGSIANGSDTMQLGHYDGSGTLLVDGTGSNVATDAVFLGGQGHSGTATFRNAATGTFGIFVAASGDGVLNVESGAAITGDSLHLAWINGAPHTGVITITGAGSAVTITGAGTTNIGEASGGGGTLNLQSGGRLNTGTGATTIHATGTVNLTGGFLSLNGNLTVDGLLTANPTGFLNVAAGKTVTFQNGGEGNFSSFNVQDFTTTVTGAGSILSAPGGLEIVTEPGETSALSVTSGGSVNAGQVTLSGGAFSVSGTGSSLITDGTLLGRDSGGPNVASQMTLSDAATAALGFLEVGDDALDAAASLTIQTGADATASSLIVGNDPGGDGGVIVTGSGSTLSVSGASYFGATGGGDGALTVQNGAAFSSAQGSFLGDLGTLTLASGGSANFRGGLSHEGTLNFTSGTSTLGGLGGGPVTQTGGSTTVAAGATAVFSVDTYARNGGTFDVAAGGTARFLDWLTGNGGFTGAGTVELMEFSNYFPGAGPAAVSFGGNLIARGLLSIDVGGPMPGTQHDKLTIAGNVTLDTLAVVMNFTNNFAPAAGQTFDIIDAAGMLTGNASGFLDSGLLPGWEFSVDEIPAQGIVRITSLSDATTATGPNVREWDGTGADNNLSTAANWIGDTAPSSDLANTVLIFADNTLRPAPNLSAPLSAKAVYFPDTAGSFSLNHQAGQALSLGAYGIRSDSSSNQTFFCPLDFSGVVNSKIEAHGGAISCDGLLTLPTGTLQVFGDSSAPIQLGDVVGTGTLETANVVLSPTVVQHYDLHAFDNLATESDFLPDVFGASASITLDGAHFTIGDDLTFAGATFSAGAGSRVTMLGGTHWTVQNGSDVDMRDIELQFHVDGTNGLTISGSGSTFLLPEGPVAGVFRFLQIEALAGGAISTAHPAIGSIIGSGNTLVDGAGSSMAANVLLVEAPAFPTGTPSAVFRNSGTGTFKQLTIGDEMRIESGGSVTTELLIREASSELTISGAGSALAVTGVIAFTLQGETRIETGGSLTVANTGVLLNSASNFSLGGGGTATFSQGISGSNYYITADAGGTNHLHGDAPGAELIDVIGSGTTLVLHDDFGANQIYIESGATLRCLSEIQDPVHTTFGNTPTQGTIEFHGGISFEGDGVEADTQPEFNVLFAATNTLSLGLASNLGYDSLTFSGAGPGPKVTWGGKLRIVLESVFVPAIGDSFAIFGFNPASDAGTFASFEMPVLPTGRGWDISALYTTGTISVVAISGIEQWRVDHFGIAAYNPEAGDLADADFDATENLLEYALGLDPLVNSAAGLPVASFTTIGPDEFLTLTFTRPLAVTDIDYLVEVGSSPAAFLPGSRYGVSGDVPNNANTTQVSRTTVGPNEIIVVRDNTPRSLAPVRVIRLKITRP